MEQKIDAIILSAGIGERTKLNYPKQLMRLGGKPILIHVLEVLRSLEYINKLIITVPEDVDYYCGLISGYNIKNFVCILGGGTRQESCRKALKYVSTEKVLIHESARPFITKDFVNKIVETEGDAIVPYVKQSQTIFYSHRYLNRDFVYQVQLPQLYTTERLEFAHKKGSRYSYTDDSSMYFYEVGYKPTFIEGLEENIKITTPLDVKIAEVLYEEYSNSNRW